MELDSGPCPVQVSSDEMNSDEVRRVMWCERSFNRKTLNVNILCVVQDQIQEAECIIFFW